MHSKSVSKPLGHCASPSVPFELGMRNSPSNSVKRHGSWRSISTKGDVAREKIVGITGASLPEAPKKPTLACGWLRPGGEVTESEIKEALQLLDRLLAMLWRLTH